MKAKSGKKITPVTPKPPQAAFDADDAEPGTVAKTKAREASKEQGTLSVATAKPFVPPNKQAASTGSESESESEEQQNGWIEVEMVGEDDLPIAGERYEITLPDGRVSSGTLDGKGFARIEGFEPGECKISFPDLDKDAWEPA